MLPYDYRLGAVMLCTFSRSYEEMAHLHHLLVKMGFASKSCQWSYVAMVLVCLLVLMLFWLYQDSMSRVQLDTTATRIASVGYNNPARVLPDSPAIMHLTTPLGQSSETQPAQVSVLRTLLNISLIYIFVLC